MAVSGAPDVPKSFEEMERERELAQYELNMMWQKWDMDAQEKARIVDLAASKQEIIRRNIEACLNVIKCNNSLIASVSTTQSTRDMAEEKLREFIKALQLP